MTGILSALPYSDFCNNAIIDLQAIADAPIELGGDSENTLLPQVHSLNCLKDIFTDAQLGPSTEPHMADTLEIAASCFESEMYALMGC